MDGFKVSTHKILESNLVEFFFKFQAFDVLDVNAKGLDTFKILESNFVEENF